MKQNNFLDLGNNDLIKEMESIGKEANILFDGLNGEVKEMDNEIIKLVNAPLVK